MLLSDGQARLANSQFLSARVRLIFRNSYRNRCMQTLSLRLALNCFSLDWASSMWSQRAALPLTHGCCSACTAVSRFVASRTSSFEIKSYRNNSATHVHAESTYREVFARGWSPRPKHSPMPHPPSQNEIMEPELDKALWSAQSASECTRTSNLWRNFPERGNPQSIRLWC